MYIYGHFHTQYEQAAGAVRCDMELRRVFRARYL